MSGMIATHASSVFDQERIVNLAKRVRTPADFGSVQAELRQVYATTKGQYQIRDWKVCDYDLHRIDRIPYPIRGPVPEFLEKKRYFVIMGSATSFGACATENYGHLLARSLGMPCLNLSHQGASPEFYTRSRLDDMRWYLSNAAFAIIETMSSRSVSNSRFESIAGRRQVRDLVAGGGAQPAMKLYFRLVDQGSVEVVQALVAESLNNHVTEFRKIVRNVDTPILLLWMSRRTPDAFDRSRISEMGRTALKKQMGIHPHFGDRRLIEQLRESVCAVIESSTAVGLPSRAINRFTHQPDSWWQDRPVQSYYPSPEMHVAAYERLLPVAKTFA